MRRSFWAIVIVFALPFGGCSRDLSRSQAQRLISERLKLPAAETRSIPKLTLYNIMYNPISACGVTICNFEGPRLEALKPTLYPLQDEGLISPGLRTDHTQCCDYQFTTWSLTDKGKPYLVRETSDALLVRTHTLVFGEVSGIQTIDQLGIAEVTYTLRVQDRTPFGPASTPTLINRTSSFARYDDGWRLK